MNSFLQSPLFGFLITIAAFELGKLIYRKTRIPLLHPLIVAVTLIVLLLIIFDIPVKHYFRGGEIIVFFLAPATVALAIPLYRQFEVLKKYWAIILIGIVTACITSIGSVLLLSRLLNIPDDVTASLIPKSVTTPIAVEISAQLQGIPAITVAAVILTGITGAVIAPGLLRLFHITDPIAKGIAIGSSSHAIGTSKALEMGEVEGALSSLSIGLAGLITVLLAPLVSLLFF